jgi:LuxR family maltose regulon positive regulatory protein
MAQATSVADAAGAGRAALSRGDWAEAEARFSEALADGETGEALEGLSWAHWWVEDVAACLEARERAYRLYRKTGDMRGAARMALWLSDDHVQFRGEVAVASGWSQRAARILEDLEPSPEHGWLTVFMAFEALSAHDTAEAKRLAAEARDLGRRLGVVGLEMFALATEGSAMVAEGHVAEGMRCLDEATTAALGGEYEDMAPAGWTCCFMLAACEGVRDYDRAAQWCRRIDDFSRRRGIRFVNGICRAHYGALLAWHGDWREAEEELVQATRDITSKRPFWRPAALVRLGDLRRRQGRFAEARELFAEAEGDPLARLGMAQLALDQGDEPAARDLLERILRQVPVESRANRAAPLELMVRTEVAAGEIDAAAAHTTELTAIAAAVPTPALRGSAAFAEGLVAGAAGDQETARERLEQAIELFAAAGTPVETGCAQLALADVLRSLGRDDAARREAVAALRCFEGVGAAAESSRARALVERLGETTPRGRSQPGRSLTARQLEVLRLVADGLGDREIAARLTLSEHTVHRHVANIHAKLGCSSRAAAVARASRLGLL